MNLSLLLSALLTTVMCSMSVWAVPGAQPPQEYAVLRQQAERAYADRSYAVARDLYQRMSSLALPVAEKRWVDFRLADTSWRAQAGTETRDSTVLDRAVKQLEDLIRSIERVEDRDLVWAEANESLADARWIQNRRSNWNAAWPNYSNALDYWASSADISTARERYLAIVWKMAEPSWMGNVDYWNYWPHVPLAIFDNALKIAQRDNDRARASYHIAMTLMRQGDWRRQMRVEQTLLDAIAIGRSAAWHDDALYAYADFLAGQGRPVVLEDGTMTRERDYLKALEVLRQLTREYRQGQTPYWDNAQAMIKDITSPVLNVAVSNFFLPNSHVQFAVGWRNVKEISFALHKVNLPNDIALKGGSTSGLDTWLASIDLANAQRVREWRKDVADPPGRIHHPGQSQEKLDEPLPPGAYVLTATAAGGFTARDLVLVTDASMLIKTAGDQALVWCVNAMSGEPMPNASVRMWKAVWNSNNNRWNIASTVKQSDVSGLCMFNDGDFAGASGRGAQYFAVMESDNRQAMATTGSAWHEPQSGGWRIYAFTDRPAYRPSEKVQWKIIARQQQRDGWRTPAAASLFYEITDPRGSKVADGKVTLNDFGSAWDGFDLASTLPLGEFTINFWLDEKHSNHVGGATLFRMEEYKLPEFRVSVSTPTDNGKRRAYLLGEYVEASIEASYYFGGPVANASVEVVVRQNPYYRWWTWPREFSWCYEEENPYRWWYGGGGQQIKRETIRTDAEGKAFITFETPGNAGQDMQYEIEARVIDASRREVTGNASVRVTRQRYYVHARSEHNIRKPGDEARVEFRAIDANDQPRSVLGNVTVTREVWTEIWLDPNGREISGAELRRLQEQEVFPPPPPQRGMQPWRLFFRGYKSQEILKTTVQLDDNGQGQLRFTPNDEGYYKIDWRSLDPGTAPVTTSTYVWVATNRSADLAYRSGSLQIIIDKDTVRSGQTVPAMIVTPGPNRHVLFTVEGLDLYAHQVVHVTGDVKLIEVPIRNSYVPNVWFSAAMALEGQMHSDTKEIIVPPVEEYLNVNIVADRDAFQPGEQGTFTVTATNHDGKPVKAELAIAVIDESVTYIQQEYAGDPRPFFFQQRQWNIVQTGSTFNQKSFVRLVRGADDALIDERLKLAMDQEQKEGDWSGGPAGGGGGTRRDNARSELRTRGAARELAAADAAMPPPAAAAAPGRAGGVLAEGGVEIAQLGMEMQTKAMDRQQAGANAEGGAEPAVQVRSDFRSTLLWTPTIITDEDGKAKVTLTYADALTTWKATARAAGIGAAFGIASTSTRTRLPLIARLQAPRFFVVGDSVVVSAVLNNNTDEPMTVRPTLKIEGLRLMGVLSDGRLLNAPASVEIPANSEKRVDWQVAVEHAGNAKITLEARSERYSDGMERDYVVHEHGVTRYLAKSGKARGNDVEVTINIPAARKPESTTFNVQVAPSMAVTMLDALPYLIDYPYGCTEQTMSRFLPAVVTAKTLTDIGIKPETIMGKVFGGIEQATADKTHPKPKGDLTKLDEITQASLNRLYDFQQPSGGWGWWKEGDSDHFMTAYVLWGLTLAKEAGLDVKDDVMARAAAYLNVELVKRENQPDMQAWMLHGLSRYRMLMKQRPHEFETKAMETIFEKRDRLNAYTRSLAALAAHQLGDNAKARTLVENLRNGVKRDDRPDTSVIVRGVDSTNAAVMGTAHWGEDGLWWRWSDGGVEATAFALRAILAVDPASDLVEPVTNWLIKNRRGNQWSNTRDTAIVILALNDYLRASGELAPAIEYDLIVNGSTIASRKLSAEDALAAPSIFAVDRSLIRDGDNQVRIVRKAGTAPIYFAASAEFFSLEEPVPPSGSEIFVRREYYKLVPTPTLLKGIVYDRRPLGDGDSVGSGERVEVVITIEAKNNYEYLVFEDLKPAGLEAVAIRSGEPLFAREMKAAAIERTFGDGKRDDAAVRDEQRISGREDYTGSQRWVYQELRDRKVALFIDHLPQGVWEVRYDLRAETPGRFHALPVLGHAMYVPEIRCNSAEIRIAVTDAR